MVLCVRSPLQKAASHLGDSNDQVEAQQILQIHENIVRSAPRVLRCGGHKVARTNSFAEVRFPGTRL